MDEKERFKNGMKQGTIKGIENNKLEIIKNMLNKNFDYASISEITGKTIEEIKEIENNI